MSKMGYIEMNQSALEVLNKYESEGAGRQSCPALFDGLCFHMEEKSVREKYCIPGDNRDCPADHVVVGGGFE